VSRWTSLLRQRQFAYLLTSGAASLAAPTATLVVLGWAISHAYPATAQGETFAALALALLGLSSTLPTIGAAAVAGTISDRMDRRVLMRGVNLLAIGATAAIAAILLARPASPVAVPFGGGLYLPLWVLAIFPLWTIETVAITLFRPAFNSSLPKVVRREELGTANGLVYAAALLLSVGATLGTSGAADVLGWGLALTIPLALFLATQVGLALLTTDLAPRRDARRPSFFTDAAEGYRYLWQRRELLELTLSALAINFFSAIAFVELSLYASYWLNGSGALLLGGLLAGGSLGAAVGTLAVNRLRFEHRAGVYLTVLTLGQGITVAALALTHLVWFAIGDMFLFGLFPGMYTTVFLATIQATVPDEKMGRVLAADEVGSYGLVPVGQYVGGTLTATTGIGTTYLLAGFGTMGVSAVMASFRRLRALGFDPKEPSPVPEPPAVPAAPGEPVAP
jgi:MFS family permease